MYSASNTTRNDILIQHPTRYRDDGDSIRQYHNDAVKRHAWQSAQTPILLKDLDGFELSIPWRVGRTWRVRMPFFFLALRILLTSLVAFTENAIRDWYKDAAEVREFAGLY